MTDELREECRRLGLERIAVAAECRSPEDWQTRWSPPRHAFPIQWGTCWKAVIELKVEDFPAEVGFFLDLLGFDANAICDDYAMIMTPDEAYAFALVPAGEKGPAVDPGSMSLQFMVSGIEALCADLQSRGIVLDTCLVAEWGEESPMRTATFRTPNGIPIRIWGMLP